MAKINISYILYLNFVTYKAGAKTEQFLNKDCVKQKLMLGSSFSYNLIYWLQVYDFIHTLC
jgi:hypothetical protein